jgi:multidrug efflux pump subunit AcrB
MAHRSDQDFIAHAHNTARYFTENRQVSWFLVVLTILWGMASYVAMPKRKDPEIPVKVAAAIVVWPGAPEDKVELLITRKLEEKIAENPRVGKITSTTRTGVSVISVELEDSVTDTGKEFDDIKLRLDAVTDLPQGAQPIQFLKDFGDTVSLMLTVASPKPSDVEIQLRARDIRAGIEQVRATTDPAAGKRASLIYAYPPSVDPRWLREVVHQSAEFAKEAGAATDLRDIVGPGYVGLDGATTLQEAAILDNALRFLRERVRTTELHPDVWRPIVVFDPAETEAKLTTVAEGRYTYRELDNFTDDLKRRLLSVPEVSKVSRTGVLAERVFLDFSQRRFASFGIQMNEISQALAARNITVPGGVIEADGKAIGIDPSGELTSEKEIGGMYLASTATGAPVYLRDVVDVSRGYESPPNFLNKFTWRDAAGHWQRTRAITLAVSMRSGKQIGEFGEHVEAALTEARAQLPEDLVIARTSNQPRQVSENVNLFMTSLYEAVALVVIIALLGFFEWRSALLLAICIPLTLTMTFGFMYVVGVDVQQISIASLIIALGLLVDDPVVAADAIKRELAAGHTRVIAAWLGPTKLATAILFATITNIAAYLPFLALRGDVGRFLYTLPVVMTASLVASRLVSMTFVPLLAYHLLRAPKKLAPTIEEQRSRGFGKVYSRIAGWAIDHRWIVLLVSFALLVAGVRQARGLHRSFFPKDRTYLAYVDVWLPSDAPFSQTAETARKADEVIRATMEDYERTHPPVEGEPREVLKSVTTFIGGGGPRFWFSVTPEQAQINYAQMLIEVSDKNKTAEIVPILQRALTAQVPGARLDVRELENGKPVGIPIAFRISGEDPEVLRELGARVKSVLSDEPLAERVRDDWGDESFSVKLRVDPDRANLAGVSNLDVATSSAGALSGQPIGALRDGHRLIPVVLRMRGEERAQLADVQNLYVNGSHSAERVPLRQVSSLSYAMISDKILRRNHFKTITLTAFPHAGVLPSQVMDTARPKILELAKHFPPGYRLEVGGEEEEQRKGFLNLVTVLGICILAIFLALVVQFRSVVKPLIVYAAIPYGAVGALASLRIMGSPFGMMAFLGIISLIGVIVSHVIVLFDFIEERHERGESFRDALIDAGILRLRPVLITVGATVFALFPLAEHGGPLWEPLCYAQIGGLTIATFITLLIVPVIYSIFVLDLKFVKWAQPAPEAATED